MEIPIAWDIVRQSKDKRVLEIGNVLKHYYDCHHDVVDLWERYPGVINIDILDFNPVQKYDLVISVSTFEHIGWDEKPRRPEKLLPAVDHVLQHVLAPGGKFIMTVPLGYNRALDRFLFNENLPFTRIDCMRQVESRHNLWEMSPWESILQNEFSANGEWLGKVKTNLICTITAPHG
jgi:SAM-dependent methyltransferase